MLALLLDHDEPRHLQPAFAMLEYDESGAKMRLPIRQLLFRIGRDPCLYARRVRGLRENARGQLEWTEPTLPDAARWPASVPP